MQAAHNKSRIKRIPSATKCAIAIQAITHQQTITEISKNFNCSRTTVHAQKNRAMEAAAKAFEEYDEEILFTIAVTKAFIHMMVVALFLICGSSYRGIMFFLESILGYSLSLGSVFNILDAAADKAEAINGAYDLSPIQSSAADEVFHRNQPILGIVDIESRYCALLAQSTDRDHESWAIHLLYLKARGYAPGTSIVDNAKGLIKGHEMVLPTTALRYDHFHIIRDLKDGARFLKNELASRTTETLKLVRRVEKTHDKKKKKALAAVSSNALAELTTLEQTYATFQLLTQWLQHDVLELAGYQPDERTKLYDFIVAEMALLAKQHPHRIGAIVTSLTHQRDALLDVANALNEPFAQLAAHYKVSIGAIWEVCYVARYGIDSCRYHERSSELETVIGKPSHEVIL